MAEREKSNSHRLLEDAGHDHLHFASDRLNSFGVTSRLRDKPDSPDTPDLLVPAKGLVLSPPALLQPTQPSHANSWQQGACSAREHRAATGLLGPARCCLRLTGEALALDLPPSEPCARTARSDDAAITGAGGMSGGFWTQGESTEHAQRLRDSEGVKR